MFLSSSHVSQPRASPIAVQRRRTISFDISADRDDDKETQRMKQWWRLRLVAVLGLLSLLVGAAVHAQQTKSIGQVTAVEGKVTVLRQEKFAPEPLTLQQPVFQEDIIETHRASKVRVTLIDATVISLGEQSRLELRQFAYDARQRTRSGRLAIPWGFVRAIFKGMSSPSSVELITPTAVAAIRGTDLLGEVTTEATAIVVLEGTVAISNIRPKFRGLSTLTPGMGVTVRDDDPRSAPTRWSESRIEALRRATSLQ
jgi:FecR protein